MKSKIFLSFAVLTLAGQAFAAGTAARCSVDSLAPQEAIARNRYVKACHPNVIWEHSTALNGGNIPTSYEEAWKVVQKSLEMNGTRQLPRPNHYTPVYLDSPTEDVPMTWTAPKVGPTDAESATPGDFTAYCAKPENVVPAADLTNGPIGFLFNYRCKSSCFAPEVRVFFENSYLTMKDAFEKRPEKIAVATEYSTFDKMVFKLKEVSEWTSSIRSEPYVLREFKLANGASFRVTRNHPLVTADGFFREAQDINAGDSLVRADGKAEVIASADDQNFFGKVYNVQPEGTTPKGNVIVAEGYLSGTAFVQNEGYEFINERVFRAELPVSLVK
ncbi:MAG: hypothetical protein EOP04_03100 [Proteobacteria bacterium]|nr:MAG: hypothetical protein EOP04_03100 [Pseudomonadota bacterium]